MIPISLPTFEKSSTARLRSSLEWAAETMQRILAVPFGTVGKTMAVAKTPFSNSFALKVLASWASPIMTGVIGVSLLPVLKPIAESSIFRKSPFSLSLVKFLAHLEDIHRGQVGCDIGNGEGTTEKFGTVFLTDIIDQGRAPGYDTAHHSEGF